MRFGQSLRSVFLKKVCFYIYLLPRNHRPYIILSGEWDPWIKEIVLGTMENEGNLYLRVTPNPLSLYVRKLNVITF
jgi:hypothetical protein